MNCAESRLWLHADADGELEVVKSLELSRHLKTCPACTAEHAALQSLRATLQATPLSYPAPAALRREVRQFSREMAPPSRFAFWFKAWFWKFSAAGATALCLLLIGLHLVGPAGQDDFRLRELVAGHIRSLQAEHLMDVVSTDQHTVKPWFDGKLDFAPDVKDLAAAGYPLQGGRLDYLQGRSVAALIYRHNKHLINVFVWPATGHALPATSGWQGYVVITRVKNGLEYGIVSDLNATDLGQFADQCTR